MHDGGEERHMRTSLSAEEIASYRDNGFLVCRQFLDSGEIATLKGSILEAIETMGRRKIAGAGAARSPERGSPARCFRRDTNRYLSISRMIDSIHAMSPAADDYAGA